MYQNYVCRTYRGYVIRHEHDHYVVIGNDEHGEWRVLMRVDTIEEAKAEIDDLLDDAQTRLEF